MKIPIIFEDENFLALNKPANLLVEPTKNSQKKTLIDFLKEKFPQNKNFDSQRFGLVHRLDKETSGVLLVAKNKNFFDYLKKLFKERKIKKEYLALVYGWPNKKRGEIKAKLLEAVGFFSPFEIHLITKKIFNAFTGGRPTAEEQRRLGGNPEVCPIFDLYMFHFFEDDKDVINLYNDCKCGNILCGEDKARLAEIVTRFVKEHQRRKSRCIDEAIKILKEPA